ncbi:unnamed protein product [Notodromas monacha]|uniref:Uncharacterized protein n=1 Tax=Notodromas monacha TaxID=399045 RepID=A0A7R9BIK6_9CRUS|nr:unnamed protein product [Notodromas monacha]CAG0915078.1 unnamed protein product [Notodromas monacha]
MLDTMFGFGKKLSKAKSMPNKLNSVGLVGGAIGNAFESGFGFRKREEWRFKSHHPARKKPVISPPLPPKTPPPLPPKKREFHSEQQLEYQADFFTLIDLPSEFGRVEMLDTMFGFGKKLSKAKSMPNKLNSVGLVGGAIGNAFESGFGFRKREEWRFKSHHPARKKPVISPPLPPKTPPPLPPKRRNRRFIRLESEADVTGVVCYLEWVKPGHGLTGNEFGPGREFFLLSFVGFFPSALQGFRSCGLRHEPMRSFRPTSATLRFSVTGLVFLDSNDD